MSRLEILTTRRLRVIVAATALLGIVTAGLFTGTSVASAAGERAGDVTVVNESGSPLAEGGSATPFGLKLPADAACQGDSADDGYRVGGFLVPEGTDPGGLVFGELGPVGDGLLGLWDTNTASYEVKLTAEADPGQPGRIVDVPNFSWAVLYPEEMKPGTYRIGIACTLLNDTTRYWDTSYTVVSDSSDQPAQFRWSATSSGSSGNSSNSTLVLVGIGVLILLLVIVVVFALRSRAGRTPSPKEFSS